MKSPGDSKPDTTERENPEKPRKFNWWWPAEAVANSLVGAVVVAFRGCWHRRLSWPVTVRGYSYRVCLSCGAKRLFDENTFIGYGPFRYDLNELIALEKAAKLQSHTAQQNIEQRPGHNPNACAQISDADIK